MLKRLLEKGRIVYKRAYCDWRHYRDDVREFHRQGVELIDIPQSKMSGKNSADIRMVVDALDLCYSKEHIDIFALLSGDSDFSPLVSKLKENDKRVIGCGVKSSTSDLLIANCDEFIYYDDLVRAAETREARSAPQEASPPTRKRTSGRRPSSGCWRSCTRWRQDYDPLWGSLLKQTIRRVYPGFNEQLLRLPDFLRPARGGGGHGADRARLRRQPRQLQGPQQAGRLAESDPRLRLRRCADA